MATVHFTPNLQRHLECPAREVSAGTVAEALQQVFSEHPRLAGYVLDEQQRLRKHIVVFVDGAMAQDRRYLTDPLAAHSDVFVMQALSGG